MYLKVQDMPRYENDKNIIQTKSTIISDRVNKISRAYLQQETYFTYLKNFHIISTWDYMLEKGL